VIARQMASFQPIFAVREGAALEFERNSRVSEVIMRWNALRSITASVTIVWVPTPSNQVSICGARNRQIVQAPYCCVLSKIRIQYALRKRAGKPVMNLKVFLMCGISLGASCYGAKPQIVLRAVPRPSTPPSVQESNPVVANRARRWPILFRRNS
jgi:hypothetical protein